MADTRLAGSLLSAYLSKIGAKAATAAEGAVGKYVGEAVSKNVGPMVDSLGWSPEKVGSIAGRAAGIGAGGATSVGFDVARDYLRNVQNPQQLTRQQQQQYNKMFMAGLPPTAATYGPQPIVSQQTPYIPKMATGLFTALGGLTAATLMARR